MFWQGVNTRKKIWHLTEIAASQYETRLELFSLQGITVLKWRRCVLELKESIFLQICKYSINIATLNFLLPCKQMVSQNTAVLVSFLGAFAKLRISAIRFVMSVRLSAWEQLGSHRTGFHEI